MLNRLFICGVLAMGNSFADSYLCKQAFDYSSYQTDADDYLQQMAYDSKRHGYWLISSYNLMFIDATTQPNSLKNINTFDSAGSGRGIAINASGDKLNIAIKNDKLWILDPEIIFNDSDAGFRKKRKIKNNDNFAFKSAYKNSKRGGDLSHTCFLQDSVIATYSQDYSVNRAFQFEVNNQYQELPIQDLVSKNYKSFTPYLCGAGKDDDPFSKFAYDQEEYLFSVDGYVRSDSLIYMVKPTSVDKCIKMNMTNVSFW